MTHSPAPLADLRVLQGQNYRYLLAGQSVSFLGDAMANVALAFALIEIDGSAGALGIVFTAKSLALVGCLLLGGVVADRLRRQVVLVSMDLIRVVSQGAIAVHLIASAPSVWSIALLSAVTGAATGLSQPAAPGLLTAVVPPEQLLRANALGSLGYSLARMSGPVIAGLLVASWGAGWALAADAATFAVSALLVARVRAPAAAVVQSRSLLADLHDGWHAFRTRTWLWAFVAWLSFSSLLYGCWTIIGPLVAARDLGGAAAWGFIISAQGVGGILGGFIALRINPQRPLLFAAAALAPFFLPLALFAAGLPLGIIAMGALFAEVGLVLSSTVGDSAVQRHIEPALLSRITAYRRLGPATAQPIGLALWGPLAAIISLDGALWLAFVLQILGTVVLLSVAEVRHLTAQPAERAP
jgi:MFS family permease